MGTPGQIDIQWGKWGSGTLGQWNNETDVHTDAVGQWGTQWDTVGQWDGGIDNEQYQSEQYSSRLIPFPYSAGHPRANWHPSKSARLI